MPAYNLRRLSRPEILKAIDPTYLRELLQPHAALLAASGLRLDDSGDDGRLDYQLLARLVSAPDTYGLPAELVHILCCVDEMATPGGMDSLWEAVRAAGLCLEDTGHLTAADVALQVLLRHRNLFDRQHIQSGRFQKAAQLQSRAG